ncbi:MAG: SBBP repeat-containing protein, partial [Ignavibacteria bacterium]
AVKEICVDNNLNVYLTGASSQQIGNYNLYDFATVKYNSSGQQIWATRYNSPSNSRDIATSMAVDIIGNVYVSGYSYDNSSNFDFTTIKYNTSGQEKWIKRYNGTGNDSDVAYSMKFQNDTSIIITGKSKSSISNFDFLTIKYDTAGNLKWNRYFNGTGNSIDISRAMFLDNSGNIITTGESKGIYSGYDYETIKYNSSGNQIWEKRDSLLITQPSNDSTIFIVTDVNNNIYLLGCTDGFGSGFDYILFKYNSNGQKIWERRYNGPVNGDDFPTKMCFDYSGNIIVTGSSYGISNNEDALTIKYNINGDTLWTKRYNGTANMNDRAKDIITDENNNVYITGSSQFTGMPNYSSSLLTIKYDSFGNQQWISTYTNNSNTNYAKAIALDKEKNVYITGFDSGYCTIKYDSLGNQKWIQFKSATYFSEAVKIVSDDSNNVYVLGTLGCFHKCALIRYNSNGIENWVNIFEQNSQYNEYANDLKIDNSKNLIVTGIRAYSYFNTDLIVYKCNRDGNQIWQRSYGKYTNKDDEPMALNLDSLDNIYVTGYSTGIENTDFITLKYDSSGTQKWKIGYNGTGDSNDVPSSITLDKDLNVLVGGTSFNYNTKNDIVLIKYSQSPSINIGNNSTLINKFELFQNYPNPFNPKTSIEYTLPRESNVTLKVFNILGKEIMTLVDSKQTTGIYKVIFNGSNLSSGIYFYRLETDAFSNTKKMLLIK